MDQNGPFQHELELAKRALAEAFTGRVLAWQLGGTMAAALCFVVARWLSEGTRSAVAFTLTGLGFMAAYVIACATGCVVARVIESTAEGKEERGVAPLHFLVDHLGTAVLLPLLVTIGAVLAAAVICAPTALWYSAVWQAILVVPAAAVFALALVVVAGLSVFLFVLPAMVVIEQPPLRHAFRRTVRLFWQRGMAIVRLLGVGLASAVLVIIPVILLAIAAWCVCSWIYQAASGDYYRPFAAFAMRLFSAVFLWAPICALPLAFLNALFLTAYAGLVEGLDDQEAAEGEAETPNKGEDDLEVVGEDEPAE